MSNLSAQCEEATQIVDRVRQLLMSVDTDYGPMTPDVTDQDSRQQLALLTAVIDEALVGVKTIKSTLARKGFWSSPSRDDRLYSLGDGSVLYNASTPKKTWNHTTLAPVVIEKIMASAVNKETGEIEPTSQTMLRFFKCLGVSYWKVTALKEMGINPDQYSVEGTTTYSATVKR